MFSRFFIERPRFAFVISIVLILAGALAVNKLPIAEYPDVTPPSIMVIATYTGASATDVQNTVAIPLEAEFNGLEDMIYFSSECNNSGTYFGMITFKTGIDDSIAMVNVQNAVKRAEPKLPTEVNQLGVRVLKRNNDILCMYTFTTDGSEMSHQELNNYVSTTVVDTLTRVDGVSAIEVLGAAPYAMRIWLDPYRMSAMGISTDDINRAIASQNVQAAAGTIGSEHSSKYIEFKINVKGRLVTPEEFSEIVVRQDGQGNLVHIRDIARVELGARTYSAGARFNGKEAVVCAVYRNNDANALATVNRVKGEVEAIAKRLPASVTHTLAYDPTRFITISMREIVETLLIALAMVVLITYLFLQDWRATLVPSVAIPVSLMATFPFMFAMNISINVLSMFGLVLVIGSLVDDAIVVVENCQSLMFREKLDAKAAAIKSMQQITSAIIATTLVTVACYVPLAFYGGMVGRIYIQFAITMCISLCISTFVAMTLSPVLCSLILRPPREKPSVFFLPFNWFLDTTRSVYLFFVKILVRQGIITLLLLGGILFGIWFFSQRTHSSFLPSEDKGAILVSVDLPPGATIDRTMAALGEFEQRCKGIPGIRDLLTIGGFSPLAGIGENTAFAVVQLQDWDHRKTKETQLETMLGKVNQVAATIPEGNFRAFIPPAIMGLGVTGGITLQLCSDGTLSPVQLGDAANAFLREFNARPETKMAYASYSANTPQLYLDVDRDKAQTLGLTASAIFTALQTQLASYYINDFNFKGETYNVKAQSEADARSTIEDIQSVLIANSKGEMVPLTSVATVRFDVGPRRIERFNKASSVQVNAEAKPGISSGELMRVAEGIQLPKGLHIEWSDMSYQERQNQGQIFQLMLLAMLFAYLFLVAQYESWTIPIPVMLTVSTAILGAYLGLKISGEPLSIYAQLGLVMLIGLTAKNAILMVEFSKGEREAGTDVYTAAERGASLRYRAVLMTAWSFIFGVFPLVVASGAGAGSRQAIGITTFSGMLLASTFGLVMTPALYAVFQRLREFGKRILGWGGKPPARP